MINVRNLGIAAFYVSRREIITTLFYKKYQKNELSMEIPEKEPEKSIENFHFEDQVKLSKDMIRSWVLGQKLVKESGGDAGPELNLKTEQAKMALEEAQADASDEKIKEMLAESYEKNDSYVEDYSQGITILSENREKVEEYGSSEELYKDLLSNLRDAESKEKEKASGTAEGLIEGIRHSILAMQAFLDEDMPDIKLNQENETDSEWEKKVRENIDSSCLVAGMLYNRLIASFEKFEKESMAADYPELKEMIGQLKEQSIKDSKIFREKVFEYRELAAADMLTDNTEPLKDDNNFIGWRSSRYNPEKEKNKKDRKISLKWKDALKYSRSELIDLADKRIYVGNTGAGASDLLVINRPGKDTVYFRKEDKAPPESNEELVDGLLQGMDFSPKEIKTIRDAMLAKMKNRDTMEMFAKDLRQRRYNGQQQGAIRKAIVRRFKEIAEIYDKADDKNKIKLGQACLEWVLAEQKKGITASPRIKPGRSLSDRNVATSRLAYMLGIGNMISDSRTAVIRDEEGKLLRGNLMEQSGGQDVTQLKGVTYSNKAISAHYALQIFDLICGQTDRHTGNFHVVVEGNEIVQIRGIDNDMSFGNLRFYQIKNGRNRIRALNYRAILGMPKSMLKCIMAMTPEYLEQAMGDILDKDELKFLWWRFAGVRNMIRSISDNKVDVKVEWKNPETEKKEDDEKIRLQREEDIKRLTNERDQLIKEYNKDKDVKKYELIRQKITELEKVLDAEEQYIADIESNMGTEGQQLKFSGFMGDNEDEDDEIRALKMYKLELKGIPAEDELERASMFTLYGVKGGNEEEIMAGIDQRIQARRSELAAAKSRQVKKADSKKK